MGTRTSSKYRYQSTPLILEIKTIVASDYSCTGFTNDAFSVQFNYPSNLVRFTLFRIELRFLRVVSLPDNTIAIRRVFARNCEYPAKLSTRVFITPRVHFHQIEFGLLFSIVLKRLTFRNTRRLQQFTIP